LDFGEKGERGEGGVLIYKGEEKGDIEYHTIPSVVKKRRSRSRKQILKTYCTTIKELDSHLF
jgi:hypothetical protein